jgi:hypothetical protein
LRAKQEVYAPQSGLLERIDSFEAEFEKVKEKLKASHHRELQLQLDRSDAERKAAILAEVLFDQTLLIKKALEVESLAEVQAKLVLIQNHIAEVCTHLQG